METTLVDVKTDTDGFSLAGSHRVAVSLKDKWKPNIPPYSLFSVYFGLLYICQ